MGDIECVRCLSQDRFSWTLLSMAVRIAYDINLHQDDIYNRSPFDAEMRKRLWAHICIADVQAARDRGSKPAIDPATASTPPPLNINDADISFNSTSEPEEREGLTDTSLTLIDALDCQTLRQLAYIAGGTSTRQLQDIDFNWEKRLRLAHSFRQRVHERFLQYSDYSIPLHGAIRDIVEVEARDLLVFVFRPLERHPRSEAPAVNSEQLLNVAGAALESSEVALANPICEKYRWFGLTNDQWHTLAVMVAELCVCPLGPTADKAWTMLEPMLLRSRSNIAEGEAGMLWRPLEKMVKRAREVRKNALAMNPQNEEGWQHQPPRIHTSQSSEASGLSVAEFRALTVNTAVGANAAGDMSSRAFNFVQPPGPQTPVDWTSWSWPNDYEGMVGVQEAPDEMSGTGMANWDDFIGGLQRDPTPLPGSVYSGAGSLA